MTDVQTIPPRMLLLCGLFSQALLAGCSDSGPAQETGQRIDDAVQDAQDAISPPGPFEAAGRKIDDAVDEATGN
ncbi:hypothetical protein [Thioalkalivibrio sulfidiphilus]|uniref:hypothetical protein n=1 Tax=Thioalkalivibrio sulfidiphilus TaxID=1033854 RepID=UPI003B35879B